MIPVTAPFFRTLLGRRILEDEVSAFAPSSPLPCPTNVGSS